MQIGTEFQCEIEKTVFGGDGLARCNGEVVFLPRTLPGERLIGRVTAVKKNFSRAEVVRFGQKNPRRIEPGCSYSAAVRAAATAMRSMRWRRSSNPPSWPTCSPARGSNRLPA